VAGRVFLYIYLVFIRKKIQSSGKTSVQVIDKSSGKSKVVKTIGCSFDNELVNQFMAEANEFITSLKCMQSFDFTDYSTLYSQVLASITSHKLVGIQLVLGGIFDEIGFNAIPDPLFKDLVLYRLAYPKSKLKTTEYLYRYEQKQYTEDDVYRYMDKLHRTQKEKVEQISYSHSLKVLGNEIAIVFYDVTTVYFEVDLEDDLRKTGFSKEGKHQHPQIVLGLLVSKNGYPLAYEIFKGNQFEGQTMLPIIDAFKLKYNIAQMIVVADSGLLSQSNIDELIERKYEFILGARIKNESAKLKEKILSLKLKHGESELITKGDLKLIISYSKDRAKKDQYNREKGIMRLEKQIKSGKLTKSHLNKRGYNKFLKLIGEVDVQLDTSKIEDDIRWDGLKGYITNAKLNKEEIIENYAHLWQIEKAFRIAKTDLKIRPIFHRLQKRIEAHICLNFVAYKVYKEVERQLNKTESKLSPEKVIEIAKSIYEIQATKPDKTTIKQILLITEEQKTIAKLFNF
jgi:transposase